MRFRIAAVTVGLSFALQAQDLELSGPGGQLLFDPATRSIRTLRGVPGSSYLNSRPVAANLDLAAASPDGGMILGIREGALVAIRNLGSEASELPVDGALAAAQSIRWSPDSRSAVIASANRLQRIYRDAADQLRVDPAIELGSGSGSVARLLALDNVNAIAALESPGGDQVYAIPGDGLPRLVATLGKASAAAFSPGKPEFYVADRSAMQVLRFSNPESSGPGVVVLEARDGIADPVGLAIHASTLLVANGSSRNVRTYRTSDSVLLNEVSVDDEPVLLEAVPQSTFFRLTERKGSGDILLLMDARPGQQQVFFVPAGL